MPSSLLPTPIQFLNSLLSTPPCHPPSFLPSSSTTSLLPLNSNVKPFLLTLHSLFPSELLPALDILDRRLITRFVIDRSISPAGEQPRIAVGEEQNQDEAFVYYVRSSYQPRRAHSKAIMSYEVRTKASNCSCPAFAFAAFGYEGGEEVTDPTCQRTRDEGRLGGLMLGDQVPVCKHLLACILAERCVGLEDCLEKRKVGREEMAGWAAGWIE